MKNRPPMIEEHFYDSREALFFDLSTQCQRIIRNALNQNGHATCLLSGGSTPAPLYESLSNSDLNWNNVQVGLVDERWVNPGEAGSNETFIRQSLFKAHASKATLVGMKNNSRSAAAGQAMCESHYQQFQKPFDLSILGMGPDGHTASLFPHAEGLEQAIDPDSNRLCTAINARASLVTGTLTERMSLTLYGLMQSRQLHLLITGHEKLSVYKNALTCIDPLAIPISTVLQQNKVPVHIFWAP